MHKNWINWKIPPRKFFFLMSLTLQDVDNHSSPQLPTLPITKKHWSPYCHTYSPVCHPLTCSLVMLLAVSVFTLCFHSVLLVSKSPSLLSFLFPRSFNSLVYVQVSFFYPFLETFSFRAFSLRGILCIVL